MKIIHLEEIDSTQTYLKNYLKKYKPKHNVAVVAKYQSNGIGSRGNNWIGEQGNLFFSFSIALDQLPLDLKVESVSIYMSYLLKEVLSEFGSSVWIKWPNDFYVQDKKIGGVITTMQKQTLICGIGINTNTSPSSDFGALDIRVPKEKLLELYFAQIEKKRSWKQVFSLFSVEFHKSKNFTATIQNKKIELKNATLADDGALVINNKKVYSLR